MCVAIPGRVVGVGEPTASSIPGKVQIMGTERDVDLVMVPAAVSGDFVVVHSGYALELIPRERAIETLALLGIDATD
jgi:hydrogenase expression/formation protein HypC